MADNSTQIDELRLDITVEDKTSGESSDKKVKNLATAISRLNKNLQAFDNKKMSSVFANMAKGIDPFVQKIDKVSGALNSLATIVSKMGLDKAVEETTKSISPLQKETVSGDGSAETKIKAQKGTAQQLEQIQNIAKSTSSSILGITTKVGILKKKLEIVNAELQKSGLTEKQLVKLKTQQLSIQEQINKAEGNKAEGKKSRVPLSNLLKSFGRIAAYRAIRTVIKEITQAFTDSIDGIARYNSEFRDTMGSLQSSIDKLKVSAGVGFYQVLILIEPLIQQISNGIVALANSLSKVIAQLRGAAQYTKINTDYMKKYKSAIDGTLLSFDTFTTLGKSGGIDFSQILETVDTPLDQENWSNLDNTISGLISTFKGIWTVIKPVIDGVGKLVKWLNDRNLLTPALIGLLTVITAITQPFLLIIGLVGSIISSFSQMSIKTKILTGIVAGLAATLAAIATPGGAIAKTVAATLTFAGISAIIANAQNVSAYANGGMFEGAGTMYALAGESGAEVVAQGSSGTGVLNVDQFADAMVSALVRYGAARDTSNGTTIVLDGNTVGKLVASNVGFRNEANRRNAGLNWR